MRDNRSLCPFLALLLLASAGSAANTGAKTAAVSSAKALVHSLASGDDKTPTAKFTTKMKQGLSPRKLKQAWRQVTADAGQFKGTGAIKTVPYHEDTVVFVKTLFTKKMFWTQVTLNQSGKVAGLYLKPAS